MTVQEMREKRNVKAQECRKLLDEFPGNKWGAEQQQKYNALMAEISDADAEIGRHQQVLDMEAENQKNMQTIADARGVSVDEAHHMDKQERTVFRAWLRGGAENLTPEQKATARARVERNIGNLSTTVPSEGGYLVPSGWGGELLEELKAFGSIEKVAEVMNTESGNTIPWPTTDATAETGEILAAENASVTEDTSIEFGMVNIGSHMYSSKSVAVPFQLIQDAGFDIEAHIRQRLRQRLLRIRNTHFTTGTGISQPKGAVTCAALGRTGTTGQTDSVIYEDLLRLEHSVDPAYRTGARFMFNDSTLLALKLMVDGMGRPVWKPGISETLGGAPDTIDGFPYTINQDMASMATSAKPILFGNFKNYVIRNVMNILLFRMTDSAFTLKGQVGFVAFMRSDGNLISSSNACLKYYQNSAS